MLQKTTPSHCIPLCTHKWALCLISSWNGFLFIMKLRINRIICAEIGSDDFGSISQTPFVVKSIIYFSIYFMKYSRSLAFIASPKWRLYFWEISAARILVSARLMDSSPEFQLIRSMWSMVDLNIDTFANWFLMVSIEPGREVCRKALHWQVKRPITIAAFRPKRFGSTILLLDLACIGT